MAVSKRDAQLYTYLGLLRKHLKACLECKHAREAVDLNGMCLDGKYLVLSAADEFDDIMELKRKAAAHGGGMVHACPDVAAHGTAYAMVSRPLHVTGAQDELF